MSKYFSEFIGTFGLVFAGTGAIIINDISGGGITHLGIGLVFGLIIMTMIYALGEISGAHFNPAISFGFYLAGKLPSRELLPYMWHKTLGATMPHFVSAGGDFLLETILTFFLMFVIIHESRSIARSGSCQWGVGFFMDIYYSSFFGFSLSCLEFLFG